MRGADFRFYLAYSSLTSPTVVSSLVKADGSLNTAGGSSINTIVADLTLADELKNVTESGSPNTINTTTRSVARQGTQSNEVTTVNRDLTAQFVYEPNTAFSTPTAGYEILELLELLDETKGQIYCIDLDLAKGTSGAKGAGANYQVSLSQPREVEEQVVYDVTFSVQSFYQRVQFDGSLFRAKINP